MTTPDHSQGRIGQAMYSSRKQSHHISSNRSTPFSPINLANPWQRRSTCSRGHWRLCRCVPLGWHMLMVVASVSGFTTMSVVATGFSLPRSSLVLVERTVKQDQATWVIDYQLRNAGRSGVVISLDDVTVKVE